MFGIPLFSNDQLLSFRVNAGDACGVDVVRSGG